MRTNKDYLFRNFNGKGIRHHCMHLEILNACRRVRKLQQKKNKNKNKKFRNSLMGDHGHAEAKIDLARRDILCNYFQSHISLSLAGLSWKGGQQLGKLAVIKHILTLLDQLMKSLWSGFLDSLPQGLWVRILLSCMIWPKSVCVVSLQRVSVES